MNKGFENIHKIIREENVTLDFLISSLQNLCTQLSVAFRKITNNRCAVCIKILSEGKGENKRKLKIDTLCRDIHSHSDRSFSDNKEHLVEKNTDFSNILQNVDRPEGRYFISIYIPFHQKYENSSIDFYAGKKWKFIPFHNLQNFFRKFALPYKSTIVVPICPGISTERSEKTLLGFLCVDSPNFYNFKKHFDADILNGVADGLYNIILKLKEKI